MSDVVVNQKMMRKKEMIRHIKEILYDAFCSEECERELELDFFQMWNNAEVAASYLKETRSVSFFTEEEVRGILKVSAELEQMEYDGYEFVEGRKRLLKKIKKTQNIKIDMLQDAEIFFQCMERELLLEIYKKTAHFEDSKWIFEQQAFLEAMTAFVWLFVCVERREPVEKMQPALNQIFLHRKPEKKMVETLLQNVESFPAFLGNLWINQADGYDKVCCMGEDALDLSMLGKRFVKKTMQKQIPEQDYWVSESMFLSVNSSKDN